MMLGHKRSRRDLLAAGLLAVGIGRGASWEPRSVQAQTGQIMLPDGPQYDAYVNAASKPGQFAQYTCEFDAAWVICKTFGFDVPLAEQVAIVGIDERIEPYVERTPSGHVVYGGAINAMFSGDYTSSYLARARSRAMRKVFDAYGLPVEPVNDRPGLAAALLRGGLVWVKSTVDYQPFEPVTWITPEGEELPGVLSNDHAVVVTGFNADVVVIRDLLGPTASNWQRPQEYEVPWESFLAVWDGQGRDGIAVFPPKAEGVRSPASVPAVEISGALGPRPAPTDDPDVAPAPIMPVEITGSL
jgi:hypothetical protein